MQMVNLKCKVFKTNPKGTIVDVQHKLHDCMKNLSNFDLKILFSEFVSRKHNGEMELISIEKV